LLTPRIGDDGAFEGDFRTRRSQRAKFTPLEWWRGDKFNWKRGEYGAQIEEVVKLQPDYVEPLAARNKKVGGRTGRGRSRSTARRSASVDPNREVEGWDELTNPIGVVNDWPQNKEIERRESGVQHILVGPTAGCL
jgi:centromere protein C